MNCHDYKSLWSRDATSQRTLLTSHISCTPLLMPAALVMVWFPICVWPIKLEELAAVCWWAEQELKGMTIPRLELQAATTAVRISHIIRKELELPIADSDVFFGTDTMSALRYIANENKRFRMFVANRISTIRDSSAVSQWSFINGIMKPANMVTRGLTRGVNNDWIDFLNPWHTQLIPNPKIADDDPEVMKSCLLCSSIVS